LAENEEGTNDEAGTGGQVDGTDTSNTQDQSSGEEGQKISDEQTAHEENNADDEEHGVAPQIDGEQKPKEPESDGYEYTATGQESVDSVIEVLKENKVPRKVAEEIFGEAFNSKDLSKVDVNKLEETVGKNTAAMLMRSLTQSQESEQAAAKAHAENVYELAGGKDAWNAAATWAHESKHFGDNATELNEMLAQGGRQAKAAVSEIVEAYKSSDNYTQEANLINGEGGDAEQFEPMSRREYFEALDVEQSRSGGPRSAEITKIHKRYSASKSK
jgi:hypothetical protein